MRVLVTTPSDMEKAHAIVERARKNPVTRERILATMRGDAPPAGDYEQNVLRLERGYRVVYSVEDQPVGLVAHLSVSVDDPLKAPHPSAVERIMEMFGMGRDIHGALNVWLEPCDRGQAVNVLTMIEQKG